MKGDVYTFVNAQVQPLDSRPDAWPGKIVGLFLNERNTCRCYCVFEQDGTLIAWPSSMDDEVEDLAETFKAQILASSGSTPIK